MDAIGFYAADRGGVSPPARPRKLNLLELHPRAKDADYLADGF
jgi:hypothetical protein